MSNHPNTYILSEDEMATFHIDESRSAIRGRAAAEYLSTETVTILTPNLEPIDQLEGMIPHVEGEPEVILTEEEREAMALESAKALEEAQRLEEVIRPLAMKRLRAEAKTEMRLKLQDSLNEVLELRSKLARFELDEKKTDNRYKARLVLVSAENARLKAELSKLEQSGKHRKPNPAAATETIVSEPPGASR